MLDKSAMKKRLAILGFEREGKSVLRFLRQSGISRGAEIEILDKKRSSKYLRDLRKFNLIFRSPGVPYNLKELKLARGAGVEFSSATRLFFENYRGKIIGITGTKGKGTVATLLYKILKAAKRKVLLAGNIGKPALDFLPQQKKYPLAVLELSSFQLQDLTASPQIAVILDVFPDHQDAHLNLKEYYEAKANMGKFQRKTGRIFYFTDNALSRKLAMKSPARKIPVDYRRFKLFKNEDLRIRGRHNFKNAVAAATVAASLGVSKTLIRKLVRGFRGLEHRLEFVKKVMVRQAHHKNKSAIYFYNDSASTNPTTTAAAIRAFSDPPSLKLRRAGERQETGENGVVLIAGGQDKKLNYSPLRAALKKYKTEAVVLFGENKTKIRRAIKGAAKVETARNLEGAVREAYKIAKTYNMKFETCNVVFSPGAASFDMFRDYADRGEEFKRIVRKLGK